MIDHNLNQILFTFFLNKKENVTQFYDFLYVR